MLSHRWCSLMLAALLAQRRSGVSAWQLASSALLPLRKRRGQGRSTLHYGVSQVRLFSTDQDRFEVNAPFPPAGDQPQAIQTLIEQVEQGDRFSVLRGCTGTGKTLVMSHVIAGTNKPTLVLCHNKTLAAQLARELRSFLKGSVVELFVSYYNHYRPEFYKEASGSYMAKKSSVNPDLDVLRHRATRALATRRNVVVVSSVSCLFGLGLPKEYLDACRELRVGSTDVNATQLEDDLVELLQYKLNQETLEDGEFERGQYQVHEKGDRSVWTLWPPYEKFPLQVEFERRKDDDQLYRINSIQQGSESGFHAIDHTKLFPASHHFTPSLDRACGAIEEELMDQLDYFRKENKGDAANRLQQNVLRDLEQLRKLKFCKGIENYSRHLANRPAGAPPETLMDYLRLLNGDDWLLMVDESHVTLPQLRSMYEGDQARKRVLVRNGFRLPSALDNRPLSETEFWKRTSQTIFVSATPSRRELEWSPRPPVDMVIRPTFVCDPVIEVRPSNGDHLNDLIQEIRNRTEKNQRSLVITLTKRDSEDLARFLEENGVKTKYLHSGLKTVERSDALRALQMKEIDCLVGVNCLREGIDLPQVSLVAVLNADSEGFLRSDTALLQVVGRAARNIEGHAIFYANRVTGSMKQCIDVTARRRQKQLLYNKENEREARSTTGSSALSFFDILKDQIELEKSMSTNQAKSSAAAEVHVEEGEVHVEEGKEGKKSRPPSEIVTDHVPNSPGVYFWKDARGDILYIGKAVSLRSRVKSYLRPSASHSSRIREMVRRADSVDIVLTPSERDALVLESNLIKQHQPPFNVLLRDDEHYPYICASVGDSIPTLTVAQSRQKEGNASNRYRYFGPYTSFQELNSILDEIERIYDLRVKSFMARQGSMPRTEYQELFQKALAEVFVDSNDNVSNNRRHDNESLLRKRKKYEEASLLFDAARNACRDVVTAQIVRGQEAVVGVIQLRDGIMAGKYRYQCRIPVGIEEDDLSSVIQTVLAERHYPAGEPSANWFPDSVLLSVPPVDARALQDTIRDERRRVGGKGGRIRVEVASQGKYREVDAKALEFANTNIEQDVRMVYHQQSSNSNDKNNHDKKHKTYDHDHYQRIPAWEGKVAAAELAQLLALPGPPERIECYDISHTQGDFAVGSRVVFLDGVPAPHLYRQFHIVDGDNNDYASLEQVLERRFRHAKDAKTDDDPWALPDLVLIDGGKGQLSSAMKGMRQAHVWPHLNSEDDVPSDNRNKAIDDKRRYVVPVCALAKDQEHVFVPGRSEPVNQQTGPDSPGLLLLRALRDESHRFAIRAHRRRRSVAQLAANTKVTTNGSPRSVSSFSSSSSGGSQQNTTGTQLHQGMA